MVAWPPGSEPDRPTHRRARRSVRANRPGVWPRPPRPQQRASPAANRSAALPARPCPSLGRSGEWRRDPAHDRRPGCRGLAGRPWRWRRPIARWIASDGRFVARGVDRVVARIVNRVVARVERPLFVELGGQRAVVGPVDGLVDGDRDRRCLGRQAGTAGVSRLAFRPILERGADREGAGQAIRLLMRDGPRRRRRLGETSMSMVGARGPTLAIVTERDEWTGRGPVRAGQPSLSHLPDDTRAPPRAGRWFIDGRTSPPLQRRGRRTARRSHRSRPWSANRRPGRTGRCRRNRQ